MQRKLIVFQPSIFRCLWLSVSRRGTISAKQNAKCLFRTRFHCCINDWELYTRATTRIFVEQVVDSECNQFPLQIRRFVHITALKISQSSFSFLLKIPIPEKWDILPQFDFSAACFVLILKKKLSRKHGLKKCCSFSFPVSIPKMFSGLTIYKSH